MEEQAGFDEKDGERVSKGDPDWEVRFEEGDVENPMVSLQHALSILQGPKAKTRTCREPTAREGKGTGGRRGRRPHHFVLLTLLLFFRLQNWSMRYRWYLVFTAGLLVLNA